VHCCSDADRLVGLGYNHDLEAIADLKIGAAGTGRIGESHDRVLGGHGNGSYRQDK
jgi:hypothetical protein